MDPSIQTPDALHIRTLVVRSSCTSRTGWQAPLSPHRPADSTGLICVSMMMSWMRWCALMSPVDTGRASVKCVRCRYCFVGKRASDRRDRTHSKPTPHRPPTAGALAAKVLDLHPAGGAAVVLVHDHVLRALDRLGEPLVAGPCWRVEGGGVRSA